MTTIQAALFTGETKIAMIDVPLEQCQHSRFNTRKSRDPKEIQRLAERIARNGFERTRAPWAVAVDGHYEVFAGGTRLEAARLARLETVPLLVHADLTDEEVSRRADVDNENDEYHTPVGIVDVWREYARLRNDEGWTQDRIAIAKGLKKTDQPLVARRLGYADFPERVLSLFMQNVSLLESHAAELGKICNLHNLAPWLTREQAMVEILEHQLKGDAKDLTAAKIGAEVKKYNAFIDTATKAADPLSESHRQRFLSRLAKSKARSTVKVQDEIDRLTKEIAEEKRREEEEALLAVRQTERERVEAERQVRIITAREEWFARNVQLLTGDFRQATDHLSDESVDLIFTDPPYDEESIPLYGELAKVAARILKPGGSLIAYAGHYTLDRILPLMGEHLRYWWMISLDHSGSAARLPGKWVFVHWKPLVWFVKEGRATNTYVADRFVSTPPDKALHEWQQDVSEAAYYIEQLTDEGATVCDPFCGSGTTLIAALSKNRRAIGIDADPKHMETARERLHGYYTSNVSTSPSVGEGR